MAAAGIGVSASLTGSSGAYGVQLSSANYGSAASFSVSASGTDQLGLTSGGSTYTGTDVAGTIDGQTAVGTGQMLSLSNSSSPANGLVTQVTATGITSATPVGTINYSPGIAQSLASLSANAILGPSGLIASSIAGVQNTLTSLTPEIATQQQLVATEKQMLTQEFTAMEEALAQLSSQSQFLKYSSGSSSSSSSSSSGSLSGSSLSGG